MTEKRWNYQESRYEIRYQNNRKEWGPWLEDEEERDNRRARWSEPEFVAALTAIPKESWTSLSKRWAYQKSFLNRVIHEVVMRDIRDKHPQGGDFAEAYRVIHQANGTAIDLTPSQSQAYKKLNKPFKLAKEKLRNRPEETREELIAKMKQRVRKTSIFQDLGIRLPS